MKAFSRITKAGIYKDTLSGRRTAYITLSLCMAPVVGMLTALPTLHTNNGTKGLVQTDVYNDTNIHIGRIETAKAILSISTLAALCKFYKISLTEFFKKVDALEKKKTP